MVARESTVPGRKLLFRTRKSIGEVLVEIDSDGKLWANNLRASLDWRGILLLQRYVFNPSTFQDERVALPIDPATGKEVDGFALSEDEIVSVLTAEAELSKEEHRPSETAPDPRTEARIMLARREKGRFLDIDEAKAFMPPELASIIDSYDSFTCRVRRKKDTEAIIEEAKKNIDQIVVDDGDSWRIGISHFDKRKHPDRIDAVIGWLTYSSRGLTLEEAEAEGYCVLEQEEKFTGPTHLLNRIAEKYPSYCVQKPTLSGGFGRWIGPYRLIDTKTLKELRLWEWGVLYDVG